LKSSDYMEVDLYVTNVDLELIKEHYHLHNLKYISGWKFKKINGIFKNFINKWLFIKENSEGAIRELAKLILNSLYGKFASNPKITGKRPFLKDDGSTGFEEMEPRIDKPVYTPMGVFITSWARHYTITTAQKVYPRIIYCDTDSIHLEGGHEPEEISELLGDGILGKWAFDCAFKRAKYLRQKTYCQDRYVKRVEKDGEVSFKTVRKKDHTDVTFSVTCSGMPDRIKKK